MYMSRGVLRIFFREIDRPVRTGSPREFPGAAAVPTRNRHGFTGMDGNQLNWMDTFLLTLDSRPWESRAMIVRLCNPSS
jgi:hypothetical protein